MTDTATVPRKLRKRWWILALLLLLGLAASLLLNGLLTLALVGSRASGFDGFKEALVDGDPDSQDFIAVVPIQGVIMEPPSDSPGRGSLGQVVRLLRQLQDQEHLQGLLLVVDSPGGGVTASDRIYEELRRFKEAKKIPIVAVFEDVAASGGYYVAMASDHILAHPTTVTGSIGVISHFYDFSQLMGQVGIKVNTIKSLNEAGRESFKDIGSPYRVMRPEERELMQKLISEMWLRFVEVVAAGRKGKLTLAQVKSMADGRVFSGQQALKQKLVDQVGYLPEAYTEIRKRCGNHEAKIIRLVPERSWDEIFGAQAEAFKPKLELPRSGIFYLWEPRSSN